AIGSATTGPYSSSAAETSTSPDSIHQSPIRHIPSTITTAIQQSCQCSGQYWFGGRRMSGMIVRNESRSVPSSQMSFQPCPPGVLMRVSPFGPSRPPGSRRERVIPGASDSNCLSANTIVVSKSDRSSTRQLPSLANGEGDTLSLVTNDQLDARL